MPESISSCEEFFTPCTKTTLRRADTSSTIFCIIQEHHGFIFLLIDKWLLRKDAAMTMQEILKETLELERERRHRRHDVEIFDQPLATLHEVPPSLWHAYGAARERDYFRACNR